ncbi:hypothetical protein [Cellulomonas sp. Y8]|uniref:hypothetical protein n=1 Tax=Cellulomonas sp. Y8 TaxID=2591145 RepID=UPI003D71547B
MTVEALAGGLPVLAVFIAFFTGGWGNFRGVPSDRVTAMIARRTWWVSPSLVVLACVAGTLAWHSALARAASLACGVLAAVASWRWRPARASALRTPTAVSRVRVALDRHRVTDLGRWRRTLVMVAAGTPQFIGALVAARPS